MVRDPGLFGVKQHADTLGTIGPCPDCGQPVRRSYHRQLGLVIHLDPDPVAVDDRWPREWSSLCWRWHERVGFCTVRFGITTGPVYVAHPCGIRPTRKGTSRMTAPQFGTPKAAGDNVEKEDLKGHLLLINVAEIVRGMDTKFGPADAVRCDIVVLDTGAEHSDALLFGKVLAQSLEAGVTYLGTLTKKDGKNNGNDWPWLFEGKETDPACIKLATDYYAFKAASSIGAPAAAAPAPAFVPPAPAVAAGSPPWAQ